MTFIQPEFLWFFAAVFTLYWGVRHRIAQNVLLIVASALVLVVGFAAGLVPWRIFVMILAPIMNLVFYKRALARGITSSDCIRLTWIGAGLLVAYHLWVAVGLPGVT